MGEGALCTCCISKNLYKGDCKQLTSEKIASLKIKDHLISLMGYKTESNK